MIERSTRVTFTKKPKKLSKIDGIDVNKIVVLKKESYGTKSSFKYFIGYRDNDDIKPLCIKLHQMIGYMECFDSNKTMSFKVIDKKLLKKYTKIWEKVNSLIIQNLIVNLHMVISINT